MRVQRMIVVSAAVMASHIALAAEPAPDPKVLGTSEAILAYCAKADPTAAAKYQEGISLIAQGASEESLAKVRKSEEYRQARESADESLANVDERNAVKLCSQSLAQDK